MQNTPGSPEGIQARYYTDTAAKYDEWHTADPNDEHFRALTFITALRDVYGLQTFLDVGAGTGRATKFLLDAGMQGRGIEPVPALIELAARSGIPEGLIVEGSGTDLPFEQSSFDAVLECGVLHHVRDPARVVSEMIRVARRAVFLSDSNRFGQGGFPARWLKLFLYKSGLWDWARFVQTAGKMYTLSEGDGLAYSYSVFDSLNLLSDWADQIILLPTMSKGTSRSWFHPLLTEPHVLLCAVKTT